MTINVCACLLVLVGAFLGVDSPLTVTQMLWVNLIMDTFAAMALASLPPSMDVMKDKPRRREDFIVTRPMWQGIIGLGVFFTALLIGLNIVFQHCSFGAVGAESLLNFQWDSTASEMTTYESGVFFSIFVMLQFWNMFNAKAFASGGSAFKSLKQSRGFVGVGLLIIVGQILIVTFGGEMFSTTALSVDDWWQTILATSVVLVVGELARLIFAVSKKGKNV
jgi:Ca2+-transporting ATPase